MTKQELINYISGKAAISKVAAQTALDILAKGVAEDLKCHGEALIPGVGKLVTVDKPARTGRNPATGESIQIQASIGIKFRAVKALKEAVS